ncbi:putative ribonuclease H-like domain-containing protein [Tanacetum coccineum]
MALMAFSDSEVYNDKTCSKTCLKNYETLKKQCDDLIFKLNQTEFTGATYKRGLATVKQQLITYIKNEFEKVKQEKEGIEFKIKKFDKASKDLDKLLESQITDKSKKGLGYSVVPPPHPLIYNRPNKLNLSYSGHDEFKEPEFKGYGPENKEQVSQDTSSFVESSPNVDKETVFPINKKVEFTKPKNHENPVKKSVRNMSLRAVLLKTGLTSLNTIRPVNTAHPKSTVHSAKSKTHFFKQAQSTTQRPFYKQTALTRRSVHTAKRHYHTGRPKVVNTARSFTGHVNTIRVKGGKPQQDDKGFVDSRCSRHMTGNIAYLSDFKEFDGGYVAFGRGAYSGRITGKGTLKTKSLDFEDVYFVNELKFNLFSVSQMCDKKYYVLFTDTECLVLSPNFKLPDENQILLTKFLEWTIWKQHRASCKSKVLNPITKPLFMLHMDLFGPTFMSSLMHKKYCLVVTDDYSRFTWVFFLTTKDETSEILKNFIKEIENLVDKKVKIIRSDNGTEFKNKVMDDFCREKGIKREYSVARTPQQNGVAERRNRTLIEAARTMLADSKLPTTFWAEAVSTACYVQNRVLVVKPHNKTPYELFRGFKPALSFMKPFGCHVSILNTLDSLGKFDGKSDEENKPMIEGNGPKWLFDIDSLTQSINYVPVAASTISNEFAGTQGELNAGTHGELNAGTSTQKEEINQDCIVMPIWKDDSYFDSPSKYVGNGELKSATDDQKQDEDGLNNENNKQEWFANDSSSKDVNAIGQQVNTASLDNNTGSLELNVVGPSTSTARSNEEESTEEEPELDLGNITNSYIVPNTPKYKKYIRSIQLTCDCEVHHCSDKKMFKTTSEQVVLGHRQEEGIDYKNYNAPVVRIEQIKIVLAYASFMGFLVYQMDVKSTFLYGTIEKEVYVTQPPGFKDPDHPDKVYKVVKVLYGLHQAPRAWYETLANYLLSNGFKRGKIDQTLFIKKQKGDILLVQVYVDDIIFGSTNKELCTGFEKLMKDKFQMSSMGELTFFLGLQVQQKEDGIFISQDKYVAEILKKFNYSDVKSASTPVDLEKPLVKDGDADDVDVHLYRSMIGYLMYLTASRPDIMFAVCACARFQVTPKTSHLLAVKRIFRYLKGKPTLGLWYSRDSPFELVAYTDSDYAGATLDKKSTTGGCLSWVATSTTEAEYVAAASCCGQVGDEAVHKELGDRMERAATTASSLEAEQDSGSGPRCQDTILGDVNAQTRFEITSIQSINPPLSRGYTLESEEDNMKLIGIDEILLKLVLSVLVFAIKRMLMLPVQVSAVEGEDRSLEDAEAFSLHSGRISFHTITQWLSAKSTAWNEFSSSMASLIICLATNQKFNLSKYIFDAMVKHLDGGVKFLLYPRFLQVFINQQLGNMSTHKKIFVNPFHTKKVFANMKRAGKDFSGRITPLFDTMMVQPIEEIGEDSDHPTNSTPIPIIDQPSSSSQPKKDKPSKKAQRQEAEVPQDEAEHEESVLNLQKAKDAQAKEIAALKKRIRRLQRRKISRPTGLKRLRKVGMSQRVESFEDQESLGVPEDASKQGRSIANINANVEVTLVNETQVSPNDDLIFDNGVLDDVKMPCGAKVDGKDEQSTKTDDSTAGEVVTTAGDDNVVPTTNEEITLAQTLIQIKEAKPKVVTTAATTATTTRPKDKWVVVQEPSEFRVPQEIKSLSSKNKGKGIMIEPEVPLKRKDQIALDEQIARDIQATMSSEVHENKEKKEEGREETAKEKESEEVEEDDEVKLKKLLVIKKDEDIAIDAIPLATKLPVLIDYKLHKEGMLIHYEFIGADGSSKRYSSMIRMIQGIDREDLEALWRIVKAKVTTWKLIDSSGVYFRVLLLPLVLFMGYRRMEHKSAIKEAESSAQKDALEDKKRSLVLHDVISVACSIGAVQAMKIVFKKFVLLVLSDKLLQLLVSSNIRQ